MDVDLWGNRRKRTENPMTELVGVGPEGKTCGECRWCSEQYYHNKTYFKCLKRRVTRGAGSDIRRKWEACANYDPKAA